MDLNGFALLYFTPFTPMSDSTYNRTWNKNIQKWFQWTRRVCTLCFLIFEIHNLCHLCFDGITWKQLTQAFRHLNSIKKKHIGFVCSLSIDMTRVSSSTDLWIWGQKKTDWEKKKKRNVMEFCVLIKLSEYNISRNLVKQLSW